jgi:hypothetical protein
MDVNYIFVLILTILIATIITFIVIYNSKLKNEENTEKIKKYKYTIVSLSIALVILIIFLIYFIYNILNILNILDNTESDSEPELEIIQIVEKPLFISNPKNIYPSPSFPSSSSPFMKIPPSIKGTPPLSEKQPHKLYQSYEEPYEEPFSILPILPLQSSESKYQKPRERKRLIDRL